MLPINDSHYVARHWGDPLSETLAKPEVKLPENFDQLSQEEQAMVQGAWSFRLGKHQNDPVSAS
jgi:hypothetical protein